MTLQRKKKGKGFSFLTRRQEREARKKSLRQKAKDAVKANKNKKET